MYFIENCNIVLESSIIINGCLITENDRIVDFGENLVCPDGAERIDAQGAFVGPGFVDIHVHGSTEKLFCSDPENVAKYFLKKGTTTILPTLYYNMSEEELCKNIDIIKDVMASGKAESIGGIYMEGPYMNPKYGAMPEKNLWRGDIKYEDYHRIIEKGNGIIKVWALAPEREGIEDFLKDLRKIDKTSVISVGHSEASPEEVFKLKKYGLRLQTHSTNATGIAVVRKGVRGLGPDEACFLDNEMYAEMISDSLAIHVHPETQQLLLKFKGTDRLILITDCNPGNSTPPEIYKDATDLMFDENGRLSGSQLSLDRACQNVMKHTGCGIKDAFLMASRNPARIIGMENEIGTIAVGKKANLVFVDEVFNVKKVIFNGKVVE